MLDAAGQEKKSQGAKKDAAGHIFFPTGQGFFRFHEIRFLLMSRPSVLDDPASVEELSGQGCCGGKEDDTGDASDESGGGDPVGDQQKAEEYIDRPHHGPNAFCFHLIDVVSCVLLGFQQVSNFGQQNFFLGGFRIFLRFLLLVVNLVHGAVDDLYHPEHHQGDE